MTGSMRARLGGRGSRRGGIAGSALATVLAREGVGVLLLERERTFRDKVRGENMVPWGVVEMRSLGLEDVFLAAGGCYQTRLVLYDEIFSPEYAEANEVSLDQLMPGIAGGLDVGHPQACAALLGAARSAGATVLRGTGEVRVLPGTTPAVTMCTTASSTRPHVARWSAQTVGSPPCAASLA